MKIVLLESLGILAREALAHHTAPLTAAGHIF